jgi:hypothetical protein
MNGRRPLVRPARYSVRALVKDAEKWSTTGQVHEAVVAEVRELLSLLRMGAAQQADAADRAVKSARRPSP